VEASDRITSTAAAAAARGSASLNMFHNSYFDCVDGKKTLYSSVYCAVYPFKLQVTIAAKLKYRPDGISLKNLQYRQDGTVAAKL